ncbi:MAG: hypothetical protein HC780_26525 [Leptolyngbyaceae cyanobacterium CSU_1_3]|nr:hypothetical protein [Leptolyngbyaceae cyanobacterium CSU_1_3]
MSDFYELLRKIQQRPAMYLGKRSLGHLHAFLEGYLLARREAKMPLTKGEEDFEFFQEWIEQRFGQPNTQSWSHIILFYSEDEADALNRFFELLEEFCQRHRLTDVHQTVRVESSV